MHAQGTGFECHHLGDGAYSVAWWHSVHGRKLAACLPSFLPRHATGRDQIRTHSHGTPRHRCDHHRKSRCEKFGSRTSLDIIDTLSMGTSDFQVS